MAGSRISRALAAVNDFKLRFLLPSESSVPAFTEYMGNTGILDWNSTALESNFSTMTEWFSICFDVLQAHPGISRCEFTCYTSLNYSSRSHARLASTSHSTFPLRHPFPTPTPTPIPSSISSPSPSPPSHVLDGKVTGVPQIVSYIRLNVDLLTSRLASTIYSMSLSISNPQNTSVLTYDYLNQTSGSTFFAFYFLQVPTIAVALPSTPLEATWNANYSFDSYSFSPEIFLSRRYATTTMDAFYDLELHTSITNVSAYLASLTSNTKKDRFYIFFRTPEGVLLGASHGKYFSHSDVDFSGYNPLTNPPSASLFQQYSPVNSTDATIQLSARWLLARHKQWDRIPEGEFAATLDSGRFWIVSVNINSVMQLVFVTSA